MHKNRAGVFIITTVACNILNSFFGTYSVIKHPLTQQFDFGEEFLGTFSSDVGVADFISFFFLIISGILIVLFPFTRVKLSYTVITCLNGLFMGLIILTSYLPEYAKLLIIISMIGSGLAKCVLLFPYIIVS